MSKDKDYIPRHVLESDFPQPPVIRDRLTSNRHPVAASSADAVVATMVRLNIHVLEVDPTGPMMGLLQELKSWGAITIVERRLGQMVER